MVLLSHYWLNRNSIFWNIYIYIYQSLNLSITFIMFFRFSICNSKKAKRNSSKNFSGDAEVSVVFILETVNCFNSNEIVFWQNYCVQLYLGYALKKVCFKHLYSLKISYNIFKNFVLTWEIKLS